MLYRRLGTTDLSVSEISLGCWTLGGLNWVDGNPDGWANVDENEAIAAINLAIDRGVNHFDNADVYGNGRAERLLAKALGAKSTKVTIATKIGHFPGTAAHAYDSGHIRHQCEQSLQNLQRETIDLYYFHHGDFGPSDCYLDDAIAMMHTLRQEGKIRYIGLSAYSNEDFSRLVPKIKPSVLQSWAHAMDDGFVRDGMPVRKLLEAHQMSFVAFSPLNQGLLLGKYSSLNPPQFEAGDHRKNSDRFQAESLAKLEPKIEQLKAKFGSDLKELSRAALQFLLHYPVIGCVIPGFRNVKQVEANLYGAGKPLTKEECDFIRAVFR